MQSTVNSLDASVHDCTETVLAALLSAEAAARFIDFYLSIF